LAIAAAAIALGLWFVAESIHPAGGWIDARADTSVAVALAAAIVVAACVSGIACPPSWMLAAGAPTIPLALWLSHHVDAPVYSAGVGALLMACVLYAFVRLTAERLDGARGSRLALSLLLAASGFGLLARVL
jgi:hypothetical protein